MNLLRLRRHSQITSYHRGRPWPPPYVIILLRVFHILSCLMIIFENFGHPPPPSWYHVICEWPLTNSYTQKRIWQFWVTKNKLCLHYTRRIFDALSVGDLSFGRSLFCAKLESLKVQDNTQKSPFGVSGCVYFLEFFQSFFFFTSCFAAHSFILGWHLDENKKEMSALWHFEIQFSPGI